MSSPKLAYDAINKKTFGTLETVMLDFSFQTEPINST